MRNPQIANVWVVNRHADLATADKRRLAQWDGSKYNLAHIPEDFSVEASPPFDLIYMSKLYKLGYQKVLSG